jgi:hypothetical protein
MTTLFLSFAQYALLRALDLATKWGKAKLKDLWEFAKQRVLDLEATPGLTGKQKAAVLSEELRLRALDLSPEATDEMVSVAIARSAPFLNQAIEILIPFAVIVARATTTK